MRKLFSDKYTVEDVDDLRTICFMAVIALGIMSLISSSMGIYLA